MNSALLKLINDNRNSEDLEKRRLARCLDVMMKFFYLSVGEREDFFWEAPDELAKIVTENYE